MTVALLGTGLIGAAMVEGMVRRGERVAVWNRTPARALPLAAVGASVCSTIGEAVRGAERVHIVVSDDAAVDAIVAELEGYPGVVIDHSTVSPEGAKRRAARGHFVHAPIFMSPTAARDSQGFILASGERALFERVEPALTAMTGAVKYLGERPDAAAAYKLFGNAMILTICAGLSDVYRMARALGIDPVDAHSLFTWFKAGNTIDVRGAKMARGDFAPSFDTVMARKDVGLMLDVTELFALPAVAAMLDRAIAAGHAHDDVGALAYDTRESRERERAGK